MRRSLNRAKARALSQLRPGRVMPPRRGFVREARSRPQARSTRAERPLELARTRIGSELVEPAWAASPRVGMCSWRSRSVRVAATRSVDFFLIDAAGLTDARLRCGSRPSAAPAESADTSSDARLTGTRAPLFCKRRAVV